MFSNCSQSVSEDELQCYDEGLEKLPNENSSRRGRGRPVSNAARERSRVKTLRTAFLNLQEILPSVPPDTKLSKLDVLVLATTYISHLMKTLDNYNSSHGIENSAVPIYHPVKKWPMRTRLYDGILDSTKPVIKLKRKKIGNGLEHQNYNISKKLRP